MLRLMTRLRFGLGVVIGTVALGLSFVAAWLMDQDLRGLWAIFLQGYHSAKGVSDGD